MTSIARRISKAVFILLCILISGASAAELVEVPGAIDPGIPARAVLWEQQQSQNRGAYPWKMRPALYGFTELSPAKPVRMPMEGPQAEALLIGWPSYALDSQGHSRFPELLEIIRNSVSRVAVSIITRADSVPDIERALQASGIEPHAIEFITFPSRFPDQANSRTLDTVWIRDYGPIFVYGRSGKTEIRDMSYFPHEWYSPSAPSGRVRDDAVPTRWAEMMGEPLARPRLIGEGGNLLTDGQGTCFTSDALVKSNQAIFGPTHNLNGILQTHFGCRRTIVLQALQGESSGHIDMFLSIVSGDTIFVGSYDPSSDAANAAILNRNARTLKDASYKVIRIPMPVPYTTQGRRVWATFTNTLRVKDALLVPVYRNPHFPPALHRAILGQESEALRAFRDALPGVDIIPIVSDSIILYGGAIHCVTVVRSAPPW